MAARVPSRAKGQCNETETSERTGDSGDGTELRENEMAEEAAAPNTYVATVVRDDFFNDPFFKNWWSDFDKPMASAGKAFNRQVSGREKY